jgi:PAS domain S-box-containing protein
MIDNAADLICSLDQEGKFLSVNPFVETMLKQRSEDLLNKHLHDITVGADSLAAEEYIRKACTSEQVSVFELKLARADGSYLETRWSAFWSVVEKRLFCVVHDVTEEKRISQMKEDFINMISHDLRSPLTSMLGSMSLVNAGALGPISPEVDQQISLANRNIKKLVAFVNDILDFQKLGAGKMVLDRNRCDLAALIDNSVEVVRGLAEAKNVELRKSDGRCNIYCDGSKIEQTLVNLLANAIKFTPAGTTVTIAVSEQPDAIETSVTDCGPGVPDELKDRVFEAFEQVPTRGKQEGSGLGLAIAKMIVAAHGGSIGVRDATAGTQTPALTDVFGRRIAEDNRGSTFWFRLPLNVQ